MYDNFLLQTDSYKAGHALLYPKGMTNAYAYFESRGGAFDKTVFFGLQYYLQKYLEGALFGPDDIDEARDFWKGHFGRDDYFPYEAWKNLYEDHYGALPLRIKAVPEGSVVGTHVPLFTVENTDPRYPWLVGFVETLLMKVWYPTTIATQSWFLKNQLRTFRRLCSDDFEGLDFMVHDFGYRGVSSEETAALGGAAHLLSFKGSDTVAGIRLLQEYYDFNQYPSMYGFSVPATEHSIIMAFPTEIEAFEHVLDTYPTGVVACVSDTYNITRAVQDIWGKELHDKIIARDGTLVVRPDSGDPQDIVCWVLRDLAEAFGAEQNSKGLRVLNKKVRVIQGDGMDRRSIPELYIKIVRNGFAPDNLVVGAGGGMLQSVNRDTQRFAYKVSEVTVDGITRAVAKNPASDPSKKSKAGRFEVLRDGKGYFTWYNKIPTRHKGHNQLQTVFENGDIKERYYVEEIQARIREDSE